MKKNNTIIYLAAILICISLLFTGCTEKPGNDLPEGTGGSDIAVESTSNETIETTEAKSSKYTADDKLIAFTFDDGPSAKFTNRILDVLEKNNSTATFFVVGYNIEDNLSTIERAMKLGCEIGNHSESHKNLTKCSYNELRNQVDTPNESLKNLTGKSPALFRAPGGNFKDVEEDIGMPIIQWSIDTKDWKFKDASNKDRSEAERNNDLEKICNDVVNSAEKGDIVLMHDIYDFTADLCEMVIPALVEKGFKIVSVSEMYDAYGQTLKSGKVYHSIDLAAINANAAPIESGIYRVKTKGGVLNMRSEPDTSAESVAKLENGTSVTVLRSVSGWAYIEYNSIRGWVNSAYLSKA